MTLVYDVSGELRDIPGDLLAAWAATGNPKAGQWTQAPAKPSDDAVWTGSSWTVPTPAVPESVTPYQFRVVLLRSGVSLAQVDALIDALPQPARDEARVAWEYGLEVRRDHPLIGQFASALGMDETAIDAAFREAANL